VILPFATPAVRLRSTAGGSPKNIASLSSVAGQIPLSKLIGSVIGISCPAFECSVEVLDTVVQLRSQTCSFPANYTNSSGIESGPRFASDS
jgi:hypothetical protein